MRPSVAFAVALFAVVFVMVAAVPASAVPGIPEDGVMQGGYVDPVAGGNPHGGYSATTNKCKVCHAVHGATSGSEVLLRTTNVYHNLPKYLDASWEADCRWCHSTVPDYGMAIWGDPAPPYPANSPLENNASMSCVYCHISGPFAIKKVYDGNPDNYWMESTAQNYLNNHSSSHAMGPSNSAYEGCVSCHSVHGAQTWDPVTTDSNTATYILSNNPAGRRGATAGSIVAPVTTMNQFCRDCHDLTGLNGAASPNGTWCGDHCHQTSKYQPNDSSKLSYLRGLGLVTEGPGYNGPSHIMTTTLNNSQGQPRSIAGTPDCRSCHSGGDHTAGNSWPHMTAGAEFLADYHTVPTQLDRVCLDCHDDGIQDGNFGVGDAF